MFAQLDGLATFPQRWQREAIAVSDFGMECERSGVEGGAAGEGGASTVVSPGTGGSKSATVPGSWKGSLETILTVSSSSTATGVSSLGFCMADVSSGSCTDVTVSLGSCEVTVSSGNGAGVSCCTTTEISSFGTVVVVSPCVWAGCTAPGVGFENHENQDMFLTSFKK